jgi:hypothetical protein
MKQFLYLFSGFLSALLLFGSVRYGLANIPNPQYVLPAFEAFYGQGYAEQYSGNITSFVHLLPVLVDINGDGLNDIVFQGNILWPSVNVGDLLGNYASERQNYNLALVSARGQNTFWRQRVRLNTGDGFRLVSECQYSTQQEYETNCL